VQFFGDVWAGVLDDNGLSCTKACIVSESIRGRGYIGIQLRRKGSRVDLKVNKTTGGFDRAEEGSGCFDGIRDSRGDIRGRLAQLFGDRKNGECEVSKLTLLWLRELDTGGRRNACRRDEVPCAAPQQIVSI
jgi:hypothetical protein